MAPTHWEEALDASAVSRPGTTQYEPGPTWEAWEDELREEHEYDDWESKLQASAKRDPAMRPARVTTCLLYTSPSPRDKRQSRMPSSA